MHALSSVYSPNLYSVSTLTYTCIYYNTHAHIGKHTHTHTHTPTGFFIGRAHADVKAIAVGGYHSLLLKSDGSVWGAGFNGWGSLGDGTNIHRNTFVLAWGISGQ